MPTAFTGTAMKHLGLAIAFLSGILLMLPALTAQDAKKDEDKTEKKTDADKKDDKKDPEKKDEKKDPEKKDEDKKKEDGKKKPEPKPAPEKLVYGAKFVTKVMSVNRESNREITIETQEVDPKKVFDLQSWK